MPASSEEAVTGRGAVDGSAGSNADGVPGEQPERGGPRSLDGVWSFMGLRWEDAQTVRMRVRPELINGGGLLSGVATYAMVDYCMGSTLWVQTAKDERIATISISINYVQTATEGRRMQDDARPAQPDGRDDEIGGAPRGWPAAGDRRGELLDPRSAGAAQSRDRVRPDGAASK